MPLSWLLRACWPCSAFLGLRMPRPNYLLHMVFSLSVCLCVQISPYSGHKSYWIGAHPTSHALILIISVRPCFQMRWHSEVQGVKTSIYKYKGRHNPSIRLGYIPDLLEQDIRGLELTIHVLNKDLRYLACSQELESYMATWDDTEYSFSSQIYRNTKKN